jgi:hypothetical protein
MQLGAKRPTVKPSRSYISSVQTRVNTGQASSRSKRETSVLQVIDETRRDETRRDENKVPMTIFGAEKD